MQDSRKRFFLTLYLLHLDGACFFYINKTQLGPLINRLLSHLDSISRRLSIATFPCPARSPTVECGIVDGLWTWQSNLAVKSASSWEGNISRNDSWRQKCLAKISGHCCLRKWAVALQKYHLWGKFSSDVLSNRSSWNVQFSTSVLCNRKKRK